MSATPNPNDSEPTVAMPTPATTTASLDEVTRWLVASRRAQRRRLALYALIGIAFIVGVGAGWLFFPRQPKRVAVSGPPARAVAPERGTPPLTAASPAPSPRPPDKPLSPRQMLNEIFEGRDRGLAVNASVVDGAVRVGASRPGYVYVLAASASQADGGPLFVAVLFPRAADTSNRLRAGQTLKLSHLQWPANAEFLAIVSDERRDIDVLGPLAGKVMCGSAARCSQSYGAAFFSSAGVSSESGRDTAAPRSGVPSPAAPKAPGARRTYTGSPRCSDILERASLGEPLTDEEQTFLRRDCR